MAYLGEMNDKIAKQKQLEEETEEPKTLWDMFMEAAEQKQKTQEKKFVEVV